MKKWMLSLSLAIAANLSVDAWGTRFNQSSTQASDTPPDIHFPFNANQGWFVEQSYLLMKPALGDLDYGDMILVKGPSDNTSYTIRVKKPEFDWNSGVRIGIGRYLPHDKWDISFYTTYFYGDADDKARGKLDQLKGLSASYTPFVSILSEKTEAVWRLNYFTLDLMAGREFSMTSHIIFHPYIGLRGALIYGDFKSKNFGDITAVVSGNTLSAVGYAKVNMEEDFWGIGPRIGTNFDYKFTGNWSFLGNLAGALLYGHYHVKEKSKTSLPIQTVATPLTARSIDHDNALRINLEGSLGMGWEKWFRDNTVRLAPTLLFEGSLWFDMNDYFKPTMVFSQDHGSLGLMGLSFNLQVDF